MNVATIKFVSWTLSLASFAAGGKYVYDWKESQPEIENPVNTDYVKGVLNEDLEVPKATREIVAYDNLKRSFIHMNWTGEPPPPPPPPPDNGKPTKPKVVPMKDILAIHSIMCVVENPGESMVYVTYKKGKKEATLYVADFLDKPYDDTLVKGIYPDRIEFAFTNEDREPESLYTYGDGTSLITTVAAGGAAAPGSDPLPKAGKQEVVRPVETQTLAPGIFQLGTEDLDTFSSDYQRILTEDVTTDTFWKDGKRAGIEIKSVREGSIATRHGAREGDVIISINGRKVTSESEAISYVKENSDRFDVWEVRVLRFGQEETIIYHSDK